MYSYVTTGIQMVMVGNVGLVMKQEHCVPMQMHGHHITEMTLMAEVVAAE